MYCTRQALSCTMKVRVTLAQGGAPGGGGGKGVLCLRIEAAQQATKRYSSPQVSIGKLARSCHLVKPSAPPAPAPRHSELGVSLEISD